MGQTFMQKNQLSEAIEYLELAISTLLVAGHPTEVEDVDLLILSSTWAVITYMRQGKKGEAMVHLERVACLEEPEDTKSKAHYYEGLLMLSGALYAVGRKDEAVEHLRRAVAYYTGSSDKMDRGSDIVAYDPDRYQQFLDERENDEHDFTSDVVSSRRTDS